MLAAAEVINQPVALDDFDDEPPALDYNPSEEDEQAFIAWKRESAARDHLDDPTLSLAELVERQVEFYERWDNPAGRMLAATMSELLMKVKLTNACTTPGELDGRVAALEADVRESWGSRRLRGGQARRMPLWRSRAELTNHPELPRTRTTTLIPNPASTPKLDRTDGPANSKLTSS